MKDLRNVIANEWMKMIRKKRLWITMLLGMIVVVGLVALNYMGNNYNQLEASKQQLEYLQSELKQQQAMEKPDIAIKDIQQEIKDVKQQITELEQLDSGNWRKTAEDRLKIIQERSSNRQMDEYDKTESLKLQYHLDHDVPLYPEWKAKAYQNTTDILTFTAMIFLPMLVVILIADMMSGETTSGTIKLLLVRPISRITILVGKWIVALLATIILSLSLMAVLWGANLVLYGFNGGLSPEVVGIHYSFKTVFQDGVEVINAIPNFNHIIVLPAYQFVIYSILLTTFAMLAVASLAFLCSTLFKSSMISTGVAFAFIILGTIIGQMLNTGKYLFWLFSIHLNLLGNWRGEVSKTYLMNLPLSFGLTVLSVWMILCLIVAIFYFRKKDIFNA